MTAAPLVAALLFALPAAPPPGGGAGAPRDGVGEGQSPSSLSAAQAALRPLSRFGGAARRDTAARGGGDDLDGRLRRPLGSADGAGAQPPCDAETLLRRLVAETAVQQARRMDPGWEEKQRDCAGLVRFAYRRAFAQVDPARIAAGLFRDAAGRPLQFADAGTLLRGSFAPIGRGDAARRSIRSGDLAAFARDEDGAPVFHLMLLVVPDDPAHAAPLVVYHPGEPGAEVRMGRLDDLARDAPAGWRPVPENPLFLGFYRLKEWIQ